MPARRAANIGGKVGYPPNPATTSGFSCLMTERGLQRALQQADGRYEQRNRVLAADRFGGNEVNLAGWKVGPVFIGTLIGRQLHRPAASRQFAGKGLRGKQVAARSSGRQ